MPCRCLRLRRRPAVSIRTKVRSPRRRTVSIESRVVPGCSETITRSSPRNAFSRLDFPRSAARGSQPGSPPRLLRPARVPGRRATIASRRSPVPCPWAAERGIGSPRPSRWNSSASASRPGSSILFAIRKIGLRECRRIADSSSSPGVIPAGCRRRRGRGRLRRLRSGLVGHLFGERRAVCDVDAARVDEQEALPGPLADDLFPVACDARRLVDDRLARAGQPVDERGLADVRESDDRDSSEQCVGLVHGGVAWPAAPARGSDEEAPELVDLVLDRGGCFAVALPALRQAVEGHRLAPTEIGCRLPKRQNCDPWIAARTTGTPSCSATIAAPGIASPEHRSSGACPRRTCRAHCPCANHLAHRPHGLAIRFATTNRPRAEGADQLTEARYAVGFDLAT